MACVACALWGSMSMASTVNWGCLAERGRVSCSCCNSDCRSRTSWGSELTMAMWVPGSDFELTKALPNSNAPMMSGIMTVVMRNPRVRTRSTYSRRAMSQTLCIEAAFVGMVELGHGEWVAILDGRCLLDLFDEDLFQSGFHHLEARDAGVCDGLCQQGLGVFGQGCGGAELDLDVAVVAFDVFDAGMIEKAVAALEVDEDAVARIDGFDLAHGAGENQMAAMDEGDVVAELLHLV